MKSDYGSPTAILIYVDDPSELKSLRLWLRRIPGLTVDVSPTAPAPNEQGGGWEFLSAAFASGGAGMVALQTFRVWLESRRGSLRVRVKIGEKEVSVDASNAHEVIAVLEKVLDERRPS